MDIPDKLKKAGEKSVEVAKTAGGFVVEKGKEAYVGSYNNSILISCRI
jgi:hypothetical protein